ncbi:MAG: cation transporter [Planctomycetales bacterium]|nr:cation transporter [Planctomycetales bacterium]
MEESPPVVKSFAAESLTAAAARGARATLRGIAASSLLAAVKVVSGVVGNSYALIADGVESLLDIISSLVVLGSLKVSTQPANDQHPYGYGKVEPLAALVVATALLAAAVGIAVQSVREIALPHHAPEPFTLLVLVAVVAMKELMYRRLYRTGREIGSQALVTDAWHHRSDSLTSIAAFLGISIALYFGPGYEAADDWAALFAAGVIAFNGVRLFRGAWREVLDVAPPPEVLGRVRATAAAVEGVVGIDKCRVRKSGLGMFIDIHVEVDGDLSVRDGHELGHRVKNALVASPENVHDVLVHIEPSER